ncbi:MAG TPA: isoprenylcysteine carboxylmethyltransferase family protein [Thermoanaerobaculia bacterium]|nr:isoprenylcysteine carboxylmethyltransferase family protein [Thermoanaerobaculia bacterium]
MPLFEATDAEFRFRPWLIGGLFLAAFALYAVDPHNAGVSLLRLAHGGRFDPSTPPGSLELRALFGVGALLAAAAALLRTWAAAYLSSTVVHDVALHADRLVADGPYRHLRNPLYAGIILLALGMAPIACRLGAVLLVAGIWFFTRRLIGREERQLASTQGASYQAYLAAVPRLWPALRPRLPAAGSAPRWGQAFLGEIFFWLYAASMTIFAATGESRILKWAGQGTLVAYLLVFTLRGLKRRRSS